MKSVFISLVSVALLVAGAVAQSFTINTPANVVECQPTLLQWSGGTAPYYLVRGSDYLFNILPGSSPGSAALEDLGQQSGTSVTWTCNIAAGTSIGLTLRDSTGATAQSAPFTINPGSSSCLNSTSSIPSSSATVASSSSSVVSSSSAAPGPSGSSAVNSASSTGSGSAATTASSTSGGATTGTSSAAPTTTSTNAAPARAAQFGVAGVLGAAAAALLL